MEENVMRYITNPLNAYLMIKRATSEIKLIEQRYPKESESFVEKLKDHRPDQDDLLGAVEGLLRLQAIYKLKTVDFASGIIDGKQVREPLSLHDLYVIGEEAVNAKNREYFAIEYLLMVWSKLKDGQDVDNEINEINLLQHLVTCYNRTGIYDKAIYYVDVIISKAKSLDYDSLREYLLIDKQKFGYKKTSLVDPYSEVFTKNGLWTYVKEDILYSQLCRGTVTKSQAEQAKLHCRYLSKNPYTKLARFKVEEMNLEPEVLLFVDVLSTSETHFLQSQAKAKVARAQVQQNGIKIVSTSNRVAQNAWFYDAQHEVYARITRRIEVSCATKKTFFL